VVNAAAASFLATEPPLRDVALGERILLDCDKVLGFEHPDTVAVATGLAATHQAAGRPDKASPLYSAALDVRTRTLGADHPDTRHVATALAESQAEPVTVQRPNVPVPSAGGRAEFD
jgi:hypothetical protein